MSRKVFLNRVRGRKAPSPANVEPDVIFVAPDQLDILTDKNIQGTPAMVIGILSPSTRKRDRQIKQQLYERTGVREYWMVDPVARHRCRGLADRVESRP